MARKLSKLKVAEVSLVDVGANGEEIQVFKSADGSCGDVEIDKAVPAKYEHIDFKPPKSVADEAAKGLEYRAKASPSNQGGLTPEEASDQGVGSGVARAVSLKNQDNISPEVIGQMVSFFARHEKNKTVAPEFKDEPWNDKGYVAWLLWGGDPGQAWSSKIKGQMDAADEASGETKKSDDEEDSVKIEIEVQKAIEAEVAKALAPVLKSIADLESAKEQAEAVAKAAEEKAENVTKALDMHKQLVDEKVTAIQEAVGTLGEAVKAGKNYDDLSMPFFHLQDAISKLKSDSMVLQLQGISEEVTKAAPGDKLALVTKALSELPAKIEEVVKAEKKAAEESKAEIAKKLQDLEAKVEKALDAPPAAAPTESKVAKSNKSHPFDGFFR